MGKWDEQRQADLLRVLFRLGLLKDGELCSWIDILQVRLFQASDEDVSLRTRVRYDGN
jgi:hypothetical protein